jgi:hypothetical protein
MIDGGLHEIPSMKPAAIGFATENRETERARNQPDEFVRPR